MSQLHFAFSKQGCVFFKEWFVEIIDNIHHLFLAESKIRKLTILMSVQLTSRRCQDTRKLNPGQDTVEPDAYFLYFTFFFFMYMSFQHPVRSSD